MKVSLHPAASAELHEAADWYALEAGRLTASKFITDFEQARARILDNPKWAPKNPPRLERFRSATFRTP